MQDHAPSYVTQGRPVAEGAAALLRLLRQDPTRFVEVEHDMERGERPHSPRLRSAVTAPEGGRYLGTHGVDAVARLVRRRELVRTGERTLAGLRRRTYHLADAPPPPAPPARRRRRNAEPVAAVATQPEPAAPVEAQAPTPVPVPAPEAEPTMATTVTLPPKGSAITGTRIAQLGGVSRATINNHVAAKKLPPPAVAGDSRNPALWTVDAAVVAWLEGRGFTVVHAEPVEPEAVGAPVSAEEQAGVGEGVPAGAACGHCGGEGEVKALDDFGNRASEATTPCPACSVEEPAEAHVEADPESEIPGTAEERPDDAEPGEPLYTPPPPVPNALRPFHHPLMNGCGENEDLRAYLKALGFDAYVVDCELTGPQMKEGRDGLIENGDFSLDDYPHEDADGFTMVAAWDGEDGPLVVYVRPLTDAARALLAASMDAYDLDGPEGDGEAGSADALEVRVSEHPLTHPGPGGYNAAEAFIDGAAEAEAWEGEDLAAEALVAPCGGYAARGLQPDADPFAHFDLAARLQALRAHVGAAVSAALTPGAPDDPEAARALVETAEWLWIDLDAARKLVIEARSIAERVGVQFPDPF